MKNSQAINIVEEEFRKNGYSEDFVQSLIEALINPQTHMSCLDYFSERLHKTFADTLGNIKISNDDLSKNHNLKDDKNIYKEADELVKKSEEALKALESTSKNENIEEPKVSEIMDIVK